MRFPRMLRVRQHFDCPRIDDITGTVREQLRSLTLGQTVRPGQTIAITAGSRGIANIATITRAIVDHCRELGAIPFIVPAMGSHGGGTATISSSCRRKQPATVRHRIDEFSQG